MAHAQQHAPLDDDDLRLSLALDALDDGDAAGAHDVDMDALDGVMGDADDDNDMDGFRPSAMLDRRLAEEYGEDAFYSYSACFQSAASELVEKDLDGGFVDIEQMLLNESEEFMTSQFASGACADQRTMLRAEITARHFQHKSDRATSSSCASTAANNARLVLLKQAIASSAVPSSSIFNMPPKYFDTAQSSPQKRRAHRRTFGERAQPFGFDRTNHFPSPPSMKHDHPLAAQHMNQPHRRTASIAHDEENRPPPAPTAAKVDENDDDDEMVHIKEEIVDLSRFVATRSRVPVATDESMDDEEKQECEVMAKQERALQPSFTGFRSISDDADEHFRRATTPTPYTPTMDDEVTLRTPLRRSVSTPMPDVLPAASSSHYQRQTPSQEYAAHALTSRSMSPADAFQKVAVVVQVAKDSPARMDKLEWKIGGSARPDALKRQSQQRKATTLLAAELGKVDGDVCAGDEGAALTADAAVLPPRYFRGGITSSPEKRRVHSTTFGSFARSFSFTGNAPQSLLWRCTIKRCETKRTGGRAPRKHACTHSKRVLIQEAKRDKQICRRTSPYRVAVSGSTSLSWMLTPVNARRRRELVLPREEEKNRYFFGCGFSHIGVLVNGRSAEHEGDTARSAHSARHGRSDPSTTALSVSPSFDVETEIAVLAPIDQRSLRDNPDEQSEELLGQVHAHIMLSTHLPLIERQQPSGFLRAERPSRATNELDGDGTAVDLEMRATPRRDADDAALETDMEELSGLKGRFIWLLLRMQAQQKMLHQRLWDAHVQCQVTPATESYLLPLEYANVVKVLVTDEFLAQVDNKTLQFNFLTPTPQSALPATSTPRDRMFEVPDEKDSKSRRDNAKHAEELERARALAETNEAKASAALASAQAAAAALEREREQIRVQELERQHEKSALEQQFGHERALL